MFAMHCSLMLAEVKRGTIPTETMVWVLHQTPLFLQFLSFMSTYCGH